MNLTKNKNYRLVFLLGILVVGMFGFGFALVPLYTVMCKTLGINGKPENNAIAQAAIVDKTRTIIVEFLASTNANLPWDFYPETKKVNLHPGENILINYFAKNNSAQTMTVQAIPSISPGMAAKYLKKTECFCFTQQTFKAREGREMPVLFHIDTELPKNIHTISLSYTMFDTAQLLRPVTNKPVGHI
jgi:cytochrome c oxidase assembly protein subunit 11